MIWREKHVWRDGDTDILQSNGWLISLGSRKTIGDFNVLLLFVNLNEFHLLLTQYVSCPWSDQDLVPRDSLGLWVAKDLLSSQQKVAFLFHLHSRVQNFFFQTKHAFSCSQKIATTIIIFAITYNKTITRKNERSTHPSRIFPCIMIWSMTTSHATSPKAILKM